MSVKATPRIENRDAVLDVAVIGGGISGLTLAHRLHRRNRSVVILEKQNRAGGVIRSDRIDGYLCERGPNTVFVKAALSELISELSLKPIRPNPAASIRYITRCDEKGEERFHPIRPQFFQLVRSSLISAQSKLRLLAEPFHPHHLCEDESVGSFFERRFGKEFTEAVVGPAFNGIFAADINILSIRSTFPALYHHEQSAGSLIAQGALAPFRRHKGKKAYNASFQQGLAELPTALELALPPNSVRCREDVETVEWENDHWCIHSGASVYRSRVLVLATPSNVTARLLTSCSPVHSSVIRNVQYQPFGVLHISVPSESIEQRGFGVLRSPKLNQKLLGVVFASDLYPDRARSGRSLFTCMVRSGSDPNGCDVRRPDIQQNVLESVQTLFRLEALPEIVSSTFWEQAIPLFEVGHHVIEETVRSVEASVPALAIVGNWIQGVSVADCVTRSEAAARRVDLILERGVEDSGQVSRLING